MNEINLSISDNVFIFFRLLNIRTDLCPKRTTGQQLRLWMGCDYIKEPSFSHKAEKGVLDLSLYPDFSMHNNLILFFTIQNARMEISSKYMLSKTENIGRWVV